MERRPIEDEDSGRFIPPPETGEPSPGPSADETGASDEETFPEPMPDTAPRT